MQQKLFTSESVGRGHPDKICDQIADAILDAYLEKDKKSKAAIEVLASGKYLVIAGEFSSDAQVDAKEIATKILTDLGLEEFEGHKTQFIIDIKQQSPDIALGIEHKNGDIGAGDQGLMFGYATDETKEFMPLPIVLAHKLVQKAEEFRVSGDFKNAGSDMKSQVTVDYGDPNNTKIKTILMSIQHANEYNKAAFERFIKTKIIQPVIEEYGFSKVEKILINPTGNFVVGGPWGDTGLTGRKIIVDTYGGMAHHGGGAFSGKDATKVDRSAAYAARWMAKNLVALKLAKKIEIQIAYAIGIAKPISVSFDTFGSSTAKNEKIIYDIIHKTNIFDLTPKGIIESLELRNPIYLQTSYFGHFGRNDLDLPWERLNKKQEIEAFIKNSTKRFKTN